MAKKAKIHLQGMGLVGSMLAVLLDAEGKRFTWNDIDSHINGWDGGTGCVMPSGHDIDHRNLTMWLQHLNDSDDPFGQYMSKFMASHRWCYISKAPPHQGKKAGIQALSEVGPIKISNAVTANLDSEKLVRAVRERFAEQRTEGPKKSQQLIVTHGSATAVRYTWGWSGVVKIKEHPKLKKELQGQRATYYLRKGVRIAYIYPVPHTDLYYAGTDIISQSEPNSLEIKPKYERWKKEVAERTEGRIKIASLKEGSLKEGWRPIPDTAEKFSWTDEEGVIYCRAMSGDGVRHFPELGRSVLEAL